MDGRGLASEPQEAPVIYTASSPIQPLVDAIAHRDFRSIAYALAPNVHFRALVPPGLREGTGGVELSQYFNDWFGDAEEFEMVSSHIDRCGDRPHASYRLHLRRRHVRYVCEQHAFATVGSPGIVELDLLCSGLRRREE
jgi:hypothetical protein